MRVLGIVGGIGPESTVEYYLSIIEQYRRSVPDGASPHLVIRSIDVKLLLKWFEGSRRAEIVQYLTQAVASLARAGADFALLAANTPHIFFDELRAASPIPLLSIVDATCAAAKQMQICRVGLLGTRFTMQADFYQRAFQQQQIEMFLPPVEEQEIIHHVYVEELLNGKFLEASRQRVCEIIGRLVRDHQVQGIVLAGTELPLLLANMTAVSEIPLLNTTQIHVNAAVAELLR